MEYVVPSASGIYIVTIKSMLPMPVTRDKRYVDICAKVNSENVKVGKAKNLAVRQRNYWKDFDKENVVFEPVAILRDIQAAETLIMRELCNYRVNGPKGSKLEWLQGIGFDEVRQTVAYVLNQSNLTYILL